MKVIENHFLMRIKFFWLILFQCYFLFPLLSQEKAYGSLSIGTSIPLTPFSKDDPKDQSSGLATIGGAIELKFVRKIPKEKFGIALLLQTSVNGLNINSMIEAYQETDPGTRLDWKKKVDGWRKISIQAGVIYVFPLTKSIQIEGGLYIGAAYAKSPGFILTGTGSGNYFGRNYDRVVTFEQGDVSTLAFTASLQSGFQFPINEKLSLTVNVSYHYLKPTFKNVEQKNYGMTTFEPGGAANISIFHYERRFNITQNMNTINLTGGLAYKF